MILPLMALVSGCQHEELMPAEQDVDLMEVYATIEDIDDGQTRTYLSGTDVFWSSGDQIAVFMANTLRKRFNVTPESIDSKDATFQYDSQYIITGKNDNISHNVAYYPFCDVTCSPDGSSYNLGNLTLPSTQSYVEGSVGLGAYPMVAVTENTDDVNFCFRNLCGVMQFQLKGYGFVKSVSVKGNRGEILAGPAVVTAGYGNDPSIAMSSEGTKEVTLDCGESGVELNETTPVSFFIALPPVQFEGGFTITVTDTWGGSKEYSTTKKNPVGRSKGLRMPAKEYIGIRPPQEGDYIDEYGVNHGQGIEIDGVVWAPVNCGYKAPTAESKGFPYGKLYQWGRKYGQGYDEDVYTTLEVGGVSIDIASQESKENVFYTSTSEYNYDWVYPEDDELWDLVKTEYDPCPSGWRVPRSSELRNLCKNKSSWTTNDSGYTGYWFSGKNAYTTEVPQVFFPAAGYRFHNGNASGRGSKGAYWSSTSSTSTSTSSHLYFTSASVSEIGISRALGHSVRCVKDHSSSPTPSEPEAVNLSESGTANSYIVSSSGSYKFSTVKGNSSESVGAVSSAEVLWETFGTDVTPNVGDLVKNVKYADGAISFETPSTFKEGNAVIAAKDASGNILWSWHIWLTDEPEGQVYYNNAGTMMDRNLGATSVTPGEVSARGLLYQWGRKDPFIGAFSSSAYVSTTTTWPSPVESDFSNGTIEYATAHPTTFITYNSENSDWYYTGSSSTDNTRWTTSDETKSIYDPCPAGWRISDGGANGVWARAVGSPLPFKGTSLSNDTHKDLNFSGKFGDASTILYPAQGMRNMGTGIPYNIGAGYYWSASPRGENSNNVYSLIFLSAGRIEPSDDSARASGYAVRCIREGTTSPSPSEPELVNLSEGGIANSYIVSQKGNYKFLPAMGNIYNFVGTIASVETLWESFGTDMTPNVGDLVMNVKYENGAICFETPTTFREGNAVIAAKDRWGSIIWSWHIWLTDEPEAQEYYNGAGTMMDRNLGATSATPGDVGALGLLYQWGRKDPFLGSSSISSNSVAKSTITWPSAVSSNSSNGTITYARTHPTTFITSPDVYHGDWHDTPSTSPTRWTTSDDVKCMYDPCPAGWRVPDGGVNGVWSSALHSTQIFLYSYSPVCEGMEFTGEFGADLSIWYPASGFRYGFDGSLDGVGIDGFYPSASSYTLNSLDVSGLHIVETGDVYPDGNDNRANANPVRCVRVID